MIRTLIISDVKSSVSCLVFFKDNNTRQKGLFTSNCDLANLSATLQKSFCKIAKLRDFKIKFL